MHLKKFGVHSSDGAGEPPVRRVRTKWEPESVETVISMEHGIA
jgi:hypothetical protein